MVRKYDYTVEIVVTKRIDDYHACISGHPEIWGCGKDERQAIGNLVMAHESEFNIKVNYDNKPSVCKVEKDALCEGYEGLDIDTLATLETVLSRSYKVEKNLQFKKDINYELKRVLEAIRIK